MKRSVFVMMLFITISGIINVGISQSISASYLYDVNGDGIVDLNDLILAGEHFGDDPVAVGDVNGDGKVDIFDLVLIAQHLGEIYIPSEVIGKDNSPMVLIPAGEFEMGDAFNEDGDQELPVHTVYLDTFYIDKYEITNAQYARFLNEYGKTTDPAGHTLIDIGSHWCKIVKYGNTYKPLAGYENHPVVYVSWYGAAAYAQYYGKRLPTEAEWEKAARGGLVMNRYVWGDQWPPPKGAGNFYDETAQEEWGCCAIEGYDDGFVEPAPVGSFNPNGYGLYDMAGNVWEWCADEYDPAYYKTSPKNNPKGSGVPITFTNSDYINVNSYRVFRGCSCSNRFLNQLRVSCRATILPTEIYDLTGFRCAGH